ncbi:MAG: O-antigen ligase domain-containing protein [Elainella sp. Prado103]|nr:O-antigen ligase domain-containing protein [Elainella sp. Prado103]
MNCETRTPVSVQDRQGGLIIKLLIACCAAFFLIGAGAVLGLLFPLLSVLVGLFLYFNCPILYVGFTFWLWVLSPLVNRMIIYQGGPLIGGLTTVANLVTLISVITFLRCLPKIIKGSNIPFSICIFVVLYGVSIRLIQGSFDDLLIVEQSLAWLCPILFGFHISTLWKNYPALKVSIQSIFFWIVLIMGLYGIFQYVTAPAWDRNFLIASELSGRGTPEPFGIRVWSTAEAPQTFALYMMAGFTMLLANFKQSARFPVLGVGHLAFFLSLARAGWLAWIVGLTLFFFSLRSSQQMRILISIIVGITFIVFLISLEPFNEVILERLESFINLEDDVSLNARKEGYALLSKVAFTQILGQGVGAPLDTGSTGYSISDGSIIPLFYYFGWLGSVPYLFGLFLSLFALLRWQGVSSDTFNSATLSITAAIVFVITLNPTLNGSNGILLWGFIGAGLSCRKYYLSLAKPRQSG